MHFGHKDYYMDGVKLSTITKEKDLGVLITDDLKPSVQCTEAARKLCQQYDGLEETSSTLIQIHSKSYIKLTSDLIWNYAFKHGALIW